MTRYQPIDGKIVGKNLTNYSNYMIYQGHTSFYIVAGDRPLIRIGQHKCILGTLRLFANGKPLDEMKEITCRFQTGRAEWEIEDEAFKGVVTVTAPGEALGLALKVEANCPIDFWYAGVAEKFADGTIDNISRWNLNPRSTDQSLKTTVLLDKWLEDNIVGDDLSIENEKVNKRLKEPAKMILRCDGEAKKDGLYIRGTINEYLTIGYNQAHENFEETFHAGIARSERLLNELVLKTPNEYLNTVSKAAVAEMDASWHPPKTMHGNMGWNQPFVGWLMHTHYLLGHHDRMKMTLKAYYDAMIKEDKPYDDRDRMHDGGMPGKNSRFYGQGYVTEDQSFYNMQTQMLHEMISAWRYSGDPEMAALLRDALRLHIKRADECFDPDGTGLYESVINTWPTDSVFTSGGGALEETCYMFVAHQAMAELTEGQEREYYKAKAEKIRKAFFEKLWIKEKGYPGAFVEWGGHKRLHEGAWLYSSFLPILCGMLDQFEAAQSVYYPRWNLERSKEGLFWFSNWTPGIWSVRECSPGENMQQAIADMRAGETEDGLNVILGQAKHFMDDEQPGNLSYPVLEGATQFALALIEGLFGYQPDYPNGKVTVYPQMPYEWDKASISTHDMSIDYTRSSVKVHLYKKANLTIQLKLYGDDVKNLTGADDYKLLPGIGGKILEITLKDATDADIAFEIVNPHDFEKPVTMNALPEGEIFNPQGVTNESFGHHIVFQKADGYWREIKLDMGPDPVFTENVKKQRMPLPENPVFKPVDLKGSMNSDIRDIFKQRYLSPRPAKGATLEMGYDGYSIWIFDFFRQPMPEFVFDKTGTLLSEKNIPIVIEDGETNAVMTTLWDNFPDFIDIPVNDDARSIALAVSGSTNPMQCGIENAKFIFTYEDGEEETLPLINPHNYIQLCAYHGRYANGRPEFQCRKDVFNPYDECLLKNFTPEVLNLGENFRTLVITWPLKQGKKLSKVRLEAMSPEVVVGLLAMTLIK